MPYELRGPHATRTNDMFGVDSFAADLVCEPLHGVKKIVTLWFKKADLPISIGNGSAII